MKTKQTKTSIGLVNGDFFDFNNPETHNYDITAIATSLSKLCRYNGHVNEDRFYSVAEHSVLVSYLVPEMYALEGLMHDSSETFTGDMGAPLKAMFPEFKKLELRIEAAMAKYYGLIFPYPPEIKEADILAYRIERKIIATTIKDRIWHVGIVVPLLTDLGIKEAIIKGLEWREARKLFLDRFEELTYNRAKRVA